MAELTKSSYVVLTTGSYDVTVEVVCRDLEHYTELLYAACSSLKVIPQPRRSSSLKRTSLRMAGALDPRQLSSRNPTECRQSRSRDSKLLFCRGRDQRISI